MHQEKFTNIVSKFMQEKDGYGNSLNMHSLLIKKKDQCYVHHFNDDKPPSDIRSISRQVK